MSDKTTRVNAVHEEDALELLDLLGVGIDYHAGRLVCSICGNPLKENGIGAARKAGDGFEFACARLGCLDAFHSGS